MRELTKSMLRMSWAMPLFGIKQMMSLSVPTRANQESATRAFDAISEAAQRQLGGAFQEVYKAGDGLQRGMVDAGSKLLFLDWFDPARWLQVGCPAPASARSPRTPASAPKPPASAGPAASPSSVQGAGWGPIPG